MSQIKTKSGARRTVRGLMLVSLATLALIMMSSLLWQGTASWRHYRALIDHAEFDQGANRFISGLFEVLMERLATNNGLQAPSPADTSVLAEIEKRRNAVKGNFDAGLLVLKEREFPNKQRLLQELDAALRKANEYRNRADQALKVGRDQRDEELRKTFIPVITDSVNAALKVWFSALHSMDKGDPALARLASVKELGWRMRDIAGAERSNTAAAIAAGAPVPSGADVRSRVDLLWQQLQNLTQDAATYPAILQAMRSAEEHYFKNFRSLNDEMRRIGETGGKYPVTAVQFVDTTTPQLGTLLGVLYAGGTASEQLIKSQISRSIREMTVLFVIMLLGIGVATVCIWLISARVARPLSALTSAMKELADGKFEAALPGLGRKDEIGDIAGAVEIFKVKTAEKAQLEADGVLRRQKAEAEARAKVAEEQAKIAQEQTQVVEALAAGLKTLADGDLTFRLSDGFTGTYLQIRDDFNSAMSQLQDTIKAIAASAREVAGASAEISGGSTDLSQRTEEQAASLEQTSASMHEISETVKKNAQSAQQANQFASGTRQVADRGGEVVAQAVSAMARIEESSRKISEIIGVIDEISRQTNLLALNAAVEAARAGEAGRGFAVVASEVRSLAQRSSQAAKDIKDLITSSSGQVQEGVDLVNRAGSSLAEIVESIKRVAEIVSEIASASTEQATGLDQVNTALAQMDAATQQNSALVEQNAASAKALEEQSAAMDERVSFFRLGEQAGSKRPPAEASPLNRIPATKQRSTVEPPRPVAAMPAHRVAPIRKPHQVPAVAARRGGGSRMQASLATTIDADDWKEF